MTDEKNPLDGIFPPDDNPEYHRKKAEHDEKISSDAAKAVLAEYGHMSDRMEHVRKNPPAAQAPTPPPRPTPSPEPSEPQGTGLQVDPTLATRFPKPPIETAPQAAPAAPAPTAPTAPTAPAVESASKDHPLLQKLREDFGIDSIPLEDISINGHTFTMRVLDTGSVATALRFADTLSMTERENAINLQIALISFAVLGMDGEPTWKIFDVDLTPPEQVTVEGQIRPIFDPMKPPTRVRVLGATAFMDFLNATATASLTDELWKAYNAQVDPKGSLEGLLKRNQEEELEEVPLP